MLCLAEIANSIPKRPFASLNDSNCKSILALSLASAIILKRQEYSPNLTYVLGPLIPTVTNLGILKKTNEISNEIVNLETWSFALSS